MDSAHAEDVAPPDAEAAPPPPPLVSWGTEEQERAFFAALDARLEIRMAGHEADGHGADHCRAVLAHARRAVAACDPPLPAERRLAVLAAALLHDVEDAKLFADHQQQPLERILEAALPALGLGPPPPARARIGGLGAPVSPDVARMFLRKTFVREVRRLVDLVSFSKNGNSPVASPADAIPRDCDRLEAIGFPGVRRALEYGAATRRPLWGPQTPRCRSAAEVWAAATPERLLGYLAGVPSATTVDHFFDKVVHLLRPEAMASRNPYVLAEQAARTPPVLAFLVGFGRGLLLPFPEFGDGDEPGAERP